ncbi:tetratricopeptide repeat protein [Nocardiopsis ganjiahuensis]|uniref:tetratricopeptide repeat protein n=1 Tax=Nocardiopsis ganjiahuensis TaxID=239984 RepID=UPI0007C65F67|nr:tetratricopeptide repeat protein [Nocardiopsis ganjiahuensis]
MSSGHEHGNGTAADGNPLGRRPDHSAPTDDTSQGDDFHTSRNPVSWPVRVGMFPEPVAYLRRRALSDVLDEALSGFGSPAAHQVLSGESGVGKTQLAAHHARSLREHRVPNQRPDVLLWADAATRDGVVFAYAQAARQLFARVPDDPELAAGQFLSWLHDPVDAEGRRWLVVWDDLTDPAEVEDLWPPSDRGHGRMIVTTRHHGRTPDLRGRRLVTVPGFSAAEADGYLRAAFTEAGIEHTDDELRALASALDHLPLALSQATAYMADLRLSPATYLARFHRRTAALVESFPRWSTRSPVAATWELAVERADAHRPEGVARPLMGLIALLGSAATPEQVVVSRPVRTYLGRRTFPARTLTRHEVRLALASLERLDLVTRDTPLVIGAHQLTQRAALEHTRSRPTREAVRAIADALVAVWPDTARDSALGRRLRSNTAVLRERTAGRVRVWSWLWEEGIHPVLFRAGRGLDSSRQVEWAVTYWEVLAEAVAHTLESDPPRHPGRPSHPHPSRSGLPGGPDHEDASDHSVHPSHPSHPDHSGHFFRHTRPPGAPVVADPLAYWSGSEADLAEAQQAFDELYERQLRVLGPDHLDTLRTRHGLAYLRSRAGDTAGAIVRYRNLLADLERVVGPDRVETLSTRGNLAVCRAESGDLSAALHASRELLADQREYLGPDHPNTLNTLHNLAHWRGLAGDPEGAVTELRELAAVQEEVLGPDHPGTLTSRHNLACWQARAHDTDGAIRSLEALVEDRRRVQGPEHPDTLTSLRQLERLRRESRARARADPSGRAPDDSGARESEAGGSGGNGGHDGNGGSHEVDPNDEPTGPQALNQSWG